MIDIQETFVKWFIKLKILRRWILPGGRVRGHRALLPAVACLGKSVPSGASAFTCPFLWAS